jgi:glycosyltransferase involved in cell wall biosynthesis
VKVIFVCQAVDQDDPVLATTVRWIEALARQPAVARVSVLALRTGRHQLPPEVEVRGFGRSNRVATLLAFCREVIRSLRPRPAFFFVYQGGPYPLLLLPAKLLCRTPIVQWKAHPAISRAMAFYARWCDDLIFTPAKASFPLELAKVRAVGHGVDTELFQPQELPKTGDLIAVCRIAPRKHVAEMITAVASANRAFGTAFRLDVYGPTLEGQEAYAAELRVLLDRLQASGFVTLHEPVQHSRMPALLSGHRAFLSFSETAVDKAVIEAMACGLPVISTNRSVDEIMPEDLRPELITNGGSAQAQARTIHRLLTKPDAEVHEIGGRMRRLAVSEHSVDRLFERILTDTRELLSVRA